MKSRGFSREAAVRFRLGLVVDPFKGDEDFVGRICIPYVTPAGVVSLKFRALDDAKPKYLYRSGSGQHLFNAATLLNVTDLVLLTEGELDAVAIEVLAGLPAVGFPGASTWESKPHFARCFDGVPEVVVVADGDEPGRQAAKAVSKSLFGSRVVRMPDGEDSNSFIVEYGVGAFKELVGI